MERGGRGAVKLLLVISGAAAAAGAAVAAMRYRSFRRSMGGNRTLAPRLRHTASGRVDEVESFSEYVARQLGFGSPKECPALAKLAGDYIKGSGDNIYSFFESDPNPEAMCRKLVGELDRCVLGYFAFHWNYANLMVGKALSSNSESKKRLKNMVMDATRKTRFDRITKDLKVTRLFSTLVEEMKAIGKSPEETQHCTEVMVPAGRSERSPVLLLMGGGMGAGKSTVLKNILKESFWTSTDAVVVEADAFKETDVIYRALSSRGHHNDMLQTAELVHQSSTDAASSLLVTALNEGRDVIMDGTLSWAPFVEQTIAMARSVHQRRYRMGVGYKVADDGGVIENYWEPVDEEEEEDDDDDDGRQKDNVNVPWHPKKPYRIELVGVVCDAYLAVVLGIRRAIMVGRAVRVKSQLRSHKMFARAFSDYCRLVDDARLYSNSMGSPPKLIAWKDSSSGGGGGSLLVDSEEIGILRKLSSLNEEADSIHELYPEAEATGRRLGSVWDGVVLSHAREPSQKELRAAVRAIEAPAT